MKLYTEEQIKEALKTGYLNFFDDTNRLNLFAQEYISKLTPIKLPSDDEIFNEADDEDFITQQYAFVRGAKYVIDKVQGGNK